MGDCMNQIKIGKFIASQRKENNLTQKELASRLGVSDRSISKWENGICMPDLSLFEPLCKELNISYNELLSGEKFENINDERENNLESIVQYSNEKVKKLKSSFYLIIFIFVWILLCLFIGFVRMNYVKPTTNIQGTYNNDVSSPNSHYLLLDETEGKCYWYQQSKFYYEGELTQVGDENIYKLKFDNFDAMVIAYKDEVIFIHHDEAVHIKKDHYALFFVGVEEFKNK